MNSFTGYRIASLLFLLTCLLMSFQAPAAESSNESPTVKTIDKRNSKDDQNAYFLVFCARASDAGKKVSVGHAFVIAGVEDQEQKTSKMHAFGFYPADSGEIGLIGPVPGKIVDEVHHGSLAAVTQKLIVKVDKQQYDRANAIKSKWSQANYQLTKTDCIAFTDEIARAVGLSTPNRKTFDLPESYISSLIETN